MNERVERMFGARESWGRGKAPSDPLVRATSPVNGGGKGGRIATAPTGPRNDERDRSAAEHREDTPTTALRSPSPCGGGKGGRIATAPAGPRNDTQAPGTAEGVKGFVSIRCGGCGRIVNTCLHEARTIFICRSCEHQNPLEHLKTMKVECPRCSFRGLYRTNREESPIVMECLNCSHPVQLRRGKRRGNYVTVREDRR